MKPNSFVKLYVHFVFTPKGRASLLTEELMDIIQKYIYGVIADKNCSPIAINGMEDHLHILIRFNKTVTIEELITDIKRSSSLFINSKRLLPSKFSWQEGYGAFTVGHRDLDRVYKYILNQREHHMKMNFRNEYINLLIEQGFEQYENYLFEFFDY